MMRYTVGAFLIAAPHAAALSTLAPPPQETLIWSEIALKARDTMTTKNRERLSKSGVLGIRRPVQIKAMEIRSGQPTLPNAKVLHFQRHGQGYHNLLGDLYRELNMEIDMDSSDPMKNPFIRPEILDSPLTDTGRIQCSSQLPAVSQLNPELVVVSPLLRAIQTAELTFRDHLDKQWVAHEGCREELGLLICNKRRPLTQIKQDFPHVDYGHISTEEDVLWDNLPDRRETVREKTDRIYDFLANFIRSRPENDIAVVGHSSWLFFMLNAVVKCETEDLGRWFMTSEVRSMQLIFADED